MSSLRRTARQRLRREYGRYLCCTIVLNSAAVECADTLLVSAEMHLHSRSAALVTTRACASSALTATAFAFSVENSARAAISAAFNVPMSSGRDEKKVSVLYGAP